MKTFNRISLFVISSLLFAACTPKATPIPPGSPGNNPYAPQAGDGSLMRSDIRVAISSLSLAKSQPPQVTVYFGYFQPTPCYQLRVEVSHPDSQNRIDLNAYAVAEKDKPCTLMALATPLQASLDLGSFSQGHYSVWLNGSKVDEFDL